MQTFVQDLRYAVRTLRKSPVFTTVAILSLALGIGANTAIFTLMDQVLFRMLPVKNPTQLVLFDSPGPNVGSIHNDNAFSYPMYVDFRDKTNVFDGMLARFGVAMSVAYKGSTERADGELVTGNYFDVLGIQPAIGRVLTPQDDITKGGHPVAVLSYAYWKRRFGGDPGIVDRKLIINGYPITVIGVASKGFKGIQVGEAMDVFVPMMMKAQMTPVWDDMEKRRVLWVNIIGRLKPGVSATQAKASVDVLYRQILKEEIKEIPNPPHSFMQRFLNKEVKLLPAHTGRSYLRKQFSTPLFVLMSMVGLVLLIACANIANLLMARAASRQREIAIRLALGANRKQLIRQLLTESVALSVIGGLAGLIVAAWTGDFLLSLLPFESATRAFSTDPDLRVLAFNFVLSLLAGAFFGLAPAIQATRPVVADTLKDQAGSVSAGTSGVRLRKGLVVAQIALSLLLLIGAGLFARSLYNLKTLNPGFVTENLMTFSVDPTLNGYNSQQTQSFYKRLRESIRGVSGVRSVSMAEVSALTGDRSQRSIKVEGYTVKEGEDMAPYVNTLGPGYFQAMGIAVILGREFEDRDMAAGAPKVGVINEKVAQLYFNGESPIGRRFAFGRSKTPDIEIIGVVKNTRTNAIRDEVERFVYIPFTQTEGLAQMTFYVRTAQPPAHMASYLRREVQRIDANLPIFGMKSMEVQVDESLFLERLVAMLSAFFGFLATLLAAIGLYGVMAYTVARRTREIGIRVALGAERRLILWLVMREVIILAAIGVAIGLPGAQILSRFIETQLYGLTAADPAVLVGSTLLLTVIALLSGYIPALRATRVDPIVALRYE